MSLRLTCCQGPRFIHAKRAMVQFSGEIGLHFLQALRLPPGTLTPPPFPSPLGGMKAFGYKKCQSILNHPQAIHQLYTITITLSRTGLKGFSKQIGPSHGGQI